MTMSTPLYEVEQLRTLEARGSALLGGDAFALMARAGEAAWRCVLMHWPQAQRIVIASGPGNNGGDGYVLAWHAHASGRDVHVLRLPGHAPASPLAKHACDEYLASGGRIVETLEALGHADLVVDALFGIGLSRALDAATTDLIDAINAQSVPVLALDVPSGVDARMASTPGAAINARRTLQFIA
ncbi:MAG: NAD(P)H-hydrate epimerase, partial [Thermomonas sp.]